MHSDDDKKRDGVDVDMGEGEQEAKGSDAPGQPAKDDGDGMKRIPLPKGIQERIDAMPKRSKAEWEEIRLEEQAKDRAAHEQQEAARTEEFLRGCEVNGKTIAALLGSTPLKNSAARREVEAFWAARTHGHRPSPTEPSLLLLAGPAGSGKTLAACESFLRLKIHFDDYVLGKSWRWGRPGVCIRGSALATMSRYGEGRAEFERIMDAPLVVLDDVGSGANGLSAMLDEIIDVRHGEGMPLIVTSNLDKKQLRDFLTVRSADRLREFNSVKICDDASFRTSKG